MKLILVVAASLLLIGCAAPSVLEREGELTGTVVQFVDSGMDEAGGPRVRQVLIWKDGQLISNTGSFGPGTFQTAIPSIGRVMEAGIIGHFNVETAKNLPSHGDQNTISVGATGGSADSHATGGMSGSTATGGSATSGSIAEGGAGGLGGESDGGGNWCPPGLAGKGCVPPGQQ